MAQITFNTDSILKLILIILAVCGLIAIGGITVLYIWDHPAPNTVTLSNPITSGISSTYPTVLTFTVLSTTTSNGHYQVLTTVGNVLYCPDYATWNMMQPRSTYTITITGYDGFAYYVGDVNLINRPTYRDEVYEVNDLPHYYYYLGKYYQCDGLACEMIPYKSVVNENVRRERPPYDWRR
jgi:hypothetical protein